MKLMRLVVFLTIFAFVGVLFAQENQLEVRNLVFENLAQRTNLTVDELRPLINWSFSFGTYDFVADDCVVPAEAIQRDTGWQRYEITYRNQIYIYLASDDLQTLVLCNEDSTDVVATSPATTTTVPVITASPTLSSVISDVCALEPRLEPGNRGVVTPGDPNWLHSRPARSSEKTGEIPGEGIFIVLEGPVCDTATGMNYWRVSYENIQGWTSEGLNTVYWLQPFVSASFAVNTTASIVRTDWIANASPSIRDVLFTEAGTTLVALDENGHISLRNSLSGEAIIDYVQSTAINLMAISRDARLLTTVDTFNRIVIWDVAGGQKLAEMTVPDTITAIIFSPDTDTDPLLVLGAASGVVSLWDINAITEGASALRNLGVSEPVASLEFSAPGTLLIARNREGKLITSWLVGG